jgi:alkylated DNA nucleotide flippase Atl1
MLCCWRGLRHRLRCDMGMDRRQAVRFTAAVPAGFWTAYSDVAAACGSDSPRSVGFWLRRSGGTIPNYWRVLTVKGEVPETFVGGGSGPLDAESARDRLRRDGVWVDTDGIARPPAKNSGSPSRTGYGFKPAAAFGRFGFQTARTTAQTTPERRCIAPPTRPWRERQAREPICRHGGSRIAPLSRPGLSPPSRDLWRLN